MHFNTLQEKYMCLKIISKYAVIDRTNLSVATIYRLMSKGLFPKQIKMGIRSVGWLESDIDDFILQQKEKSQ
jgi:prophage regulatory protein